MLFLSTIGGRHDGGGVNPASRTSDADYDRRLGSPQVAVGRCELHKGHSPHNLTVEFHHIVPVAWQIFWKPPKPWPFPGKDPNGRGELWDDRGIVLCPTGHRNVHANIVHLMGLYNDEGVMPKTEGLNTQVVIAATALYRFNHMGGSLQTLCDAHEWGQI